MFLQFWSGTFLQIQLEDRVSFRLPPNFEHSSPDRRATAHLYHPSSGSDTSIPGFSLSLDAWSRMAISGVVSLYRFMIS